MNYEITTISAKAFAGISAAGGVVSALLGGWDIPIMVLLGFMAADYVSGLVVAGLFQNSAKTESGGLSSGAGLTGIMRKVFILVLVGVLHGVDLLTGSTVFRDAGVIGFVVNELVSLVENTGLMGIDLPDALQNAIDILRDKEQKGG